MKYYCINLLLLFLCVGSGPQTALHAQERPNIVWLVSEDNSVHYIDHFIKGGAKMPNVEALARKGITFTRAFSNGPVCSVARSTLISGCYAPRIGVQYHRRTELAPLPDGLKMYPQYLKEAGYYVSNNSKEDYNLIKPGEVWNESSKHASYKNRKPGQPFFHVQNYGTTHEGKLHFTQENREANPTETNPDMMKPFPYHPNTPLSRYTYARYHDLHKKVDQQMGEFLQELDAQGLMENTFIFYYGDHGGVLPRSKGYVYESGLHVPLVVYVPEKWKHLVPAERGSRTDAFVQFIDFGPTVLNLAGVDVPKGIDGKPFLGKGVTKEAWENRNTAFSYADRFDEKYDLVRAIRKDNFKYIRNYQPFNYDGLYNFYRYRMLLYKEWRELYLAGKLTPEQQQFFKPRPAEQLFDLEKDPHEVHNLANDPAYQDKLKELRAELRAQVKSMPDLSFIPEPYYVKEAMENPVQYGQDHKAEIARLVDIAELQLVPFSDAKGRLKQALSSKNPRERYWALIVCSSFGAKASPLYKKARKMTQKDKVSLVRVRAAEFLGLNKEEDPAPVIENALKNASSRTEANLILNSLVLLQDAKGYTFSLSKDMFPSDWLDKGPALVMRRLEYLLEE